MSRLSSSSETFHPDCGSWLIVNLLVCADLRNNRVYMEKRDLYSVRDVTCVTFFSSSTPTPITARSTDQSELVVEHATLFLNA